MSGSLSYRGISAASYGIKIGGVNTYKGAGNKLEFAHIPGAVGDLIAHEPNDSIGNELKEYTAALYMRNASEAAVELRMTQIRDWLLNNRVLTELKDSYEPSFYRLGVFSGDFTPIRKGAGRNYQFPLLFSCDPRRYIDNVPDTVMNVGASGAFNATITPPQDWATLLRYPAEPIIMVEGDWSNDEFSLIFTDEEYVTEYGKITFKENIGTVYFDTRTLNATSGPYGTGSNLNPWILDVSGRVTLHGLIDYVKRTSLDAKVTITPRWWVR